MRWWNTGWPCVLWTVWDKYSAQLVKARFSDYSWAVGVSWMWSEFVLRSNFSADLVEARECQYFCWSWHLHPFNGFVHYKLPTFPLYWTSHFLMQQRRMENDTKMTLEFGRRLPRRVRDGGKEGHEFDVGWNWKNGCMVKMGLTTWSDSQEVDHLGL